MIKSLRLRAAADVSRLKRSSVASEISYCIPRTGWRSIAPFKTIIFARNRIESNLEICSVRLCIRDLEIIRGESRVRAKQELLNIAEPVAVEVLRSVGRIQPIHSIRDFEIVGHLIPIGVR